MPRRGWSGDTAGQRQKYQKLPLEASTRTAKAALLYNAQHRCAAEFQALPTRKDPLSDHAPSLASPAICWTRRPVASTGVLSLVCKCCFSRRREGCIVDAARRHQTGHLRSSPETTAGYAARRSKTQQGRAIARAGIGIKLSFGAWPIVPALRMAGAALQPMFRGSL
jgi:hypothetical protein